MGAAVPPRSVCGVLNSSSEAMVVTEQGAAIKTHSAIVRIIPESERWDADKMLGMRAGPRTAVTMHLTFRSEWRDPQR